MDVQISATNAASLDLDLSFTFRKNFLSCHCGVVYTPKHHHLEQVAKVSVQR